MKGGESDGKIIKDDKPSSRAGRVLCFSHHVKTGRGVVEWRRVSCRGSMKGGEGGAGA